MKCTHFALSGGTSPPRPPPGPLDLDAPCGRFLTYRQLIQCGETQAGTGLPKEPDSYTALHDLAVNLLAPIIDWYGSVRLTYGFCSRS